MAIQQEVLVSRFVGFLDFQCNRREFHGLIGGEMSAKFITANVWDALKQAARRSKKPASVAVAYFGKGAADLLPLPPRSRLVVDASVSTVKQGQTHPADLAKMLRRKVAVYSVRNLHAKVFAFDNSIFIGSANVSKHSANVLQEAVVRISDASVKQDARDFVAGLCLEALGPEELKRLQRLYKPPRFAPRSGAPRGRVEDRRTRSPPKTFWGFGRRNRRAHCAPDPIQ